MTVSQTLRKFVHLARRGPLIHRSARRAGARHVQALEVVAASAAAFAQAARLDNGERGRQNAMRHFIWQGYLASRVGQSIARQVADDYEEGSPDPVDSRVDSHNNAVAWQWAAGHGQQLSRLSRRAALVRLARVAAAKWSDGSLTSAQRLRQSGNTLE